MDLGELVFLDDGESLDLMFAHASFYSITSLYLHCFYARNNFISLVRILSGACRAKLWKHKLA